MPLSVWPLYDHCYDDDEAHGFSLAIGESSKRWPTYDATVSMFIRPKRGLDG